MKPGIYDLPFADYIAAEGVSQSMLKLVGRSPAHLIASREEKKKESKALRNGHVIHWAVFQPEILMDSIHLRPEFCRRADKCKVPWDNKTNDAKDWTLAHQDKPIVSQVELDTAKAIAESVRSHPAAKLALEKGSMERSLLGVDPETGSPIKCRPDWLSGNAMLDLKSTVDARESTFAKKVFDYGYDVQAAFYLDLANLLGLGKDYFLFAAVEKTPPYAVAVYQLDAESIEIGRRKYRYWMAIYAQCVKENRWPAYSDTIQVISMPEFAKRRTL